MQAIEIINEEHRLLSKVLTCLERLLQEAERSDHLDGEYASRILLFLGHFADGSHQDKEEEVLFPLLLRRAPGVARRIVQALLADHQRERQVFDELSRNLEGAAYGDGLSLDAFVCLAQKYVAIQRRHAAWEDERLLPLAKKYLVAQDDPWMLAGFRKVEARYEGAGSPGVRQAVDLLSERIPA